LHLGYLAISRKSRDGLLRFVTIKCGRSLITRVHAMCADQSLEFGLYVQHAELREGKYAVMLHLWKVFSPRLDFRPVFLSAKLVGQ
jgi:hypothetical protein